MTSLILTGNERPLLANYIYSDKIKNLLLLYKVYGDHKFMLLDEKAQKIFSLCNGKHTIDEICLHPVLSDYPVDNIKETISRLVRYEILVIPNHRADSALKKQYSNGKSAFGIWLHATNRCNLQCSYCYIHKNKEDMPLSVAKTAILNLVSQCEKNGITDLSIKFAGGEPLMVWKNLMQIVDFTRECCSRATVAINPHFNIVSNGTLVNESKAIYLYRNQIPISISLDGVGAVNDSQRFYANRKGSFSSIERGIQILKAADWKPFILITVTEKNIGGLRELTKYLLSHELSFRYSFLRDCTHLSSEYLYSASEQYVEILNKCFDDIEEWMLTKRWNFNVRLCDIRLGRTVVRTCGIGRNSAAISHKGEIALCQMIFDQPIGDITHNGIIEAVHQQNTMVDLRRKNVDSYLECRQCIWKKICAGGCSIFTYQQYGRLDRPSPYCWAFKQLIPRIVRLHGIKLLRKYEQLKTQRR